MSFCNLLFSFFKFFWKNFTTCSFLKQSQIPSQAITRKSRSHVISVSVISGKELRMFYHDWRSFYWRESLEFMTVLCFQSPIALETPSCPFKRLLSTNPPAFMTLSFSYSFFGLWSVLSSIISDFSLNARIPRLSPALAQKILSGVRRTTHAVQPLVRGICLTW